MFYHFRADRDGGNNGSGDQPRRPQSEIANLPDPAKIIVCADRCEIIRAPQPVLAIGNDPIAAEDGYDILEIRFSIWNENAQDVPDVAARVEFSAVKVCGLPNFEFDSLPAMSNLFFGTVAHKTIADPGHICPNHALQYRFKKGALPGVNCIRVTGNLFMQAPPEDCKFNEGDAVPLKQFELHYRVNG
ncbi:MAG: hypothetical protein ACE5IY_19310 [bacterium]